MAKKYCPFIKEACKIDTCMMTENDECRVVELLRQLGAKPAEALVQQKDEPQAPEEFMRASIPDLVEELVIFVKANATNGQDRGLSWLERTATEIFWYAKKINKFTAISDVQWKVDEVERIADMQINKEFVANEKARVKQENDELPVLVGKCLAWAKENKLFKKIIKSDIDAFLFEEKKDILPKTKQALYALVCVKLRKEKNS